MTSTPPPGEGWLPIDSAPRDRDVQLAAYYQPSAEAYRNGSRPFWAFGTGRWLFRDHWSGVLGGNPTWWKPADDPA